MICFVTEVLTQHRNLAALMALPSQWVDHMLQANLINRRRRYHD